MKMTEATRTAILTLIGMIKERELESSLFDNNEERGT